MKRPHERRFTCRWCGWSSPAWFRIRLGGRVNGGDALIRHCEAEHPLEVDALREALGHDEEPEGERRTREGQ
jgi:hypothetical protein